MTLISPSILRQYGIPVNKVCLILLITHISLTSILLSFFEFLSFRLDISYFQALIVLDCNELAFTLFVDQTYNRSFPLICSLMIKYLHSYTNVTI